MVSAVRIGEHWEPPVRHPLLLTVHALAEQLDVTLEHAYRISHRIGTIYIGEEHTRLRVLTAAVDALAEMIRAGVPIREAADAVRVMQGVEDW